MNKTMQIIYSIVPGVERALTNIIIIVRFLFVIIFLRFKKLPF